MERILSQVFQKTIDFLIPLKFGLEIVSQTALGRSKQVQRRPLISKHKISGLRKSWEVSDTALERIFSQDFQKTIDFLIALNFGLKIAQSVATNESN